MKLNYQAYNPSGQLVKGVVDAKDIPAARESLRQNGLFVTEIAKASGAESGRVVHRRPWWMGRGRLLKDLSFFTRQLSVLVSSGTPLTQALGALEQQTTNAYWKQVLLGVRDRVKQGDSLSQAMESYPDAFDSVYRSLIAVGETSGFFTDVLARLADLKQKQYRMRSSVMGAMIYPALLLGVSMAVLGVLMVVALPRFIELFESMDVPLPPTTVALVFVSDIVVGYWWAVLAVAVLIPFVARRLIATPLGQRAWDSIVLLVPPLGKIVRSVITARVVRLLGVLMQSHVSLLDTLRLCQNAAGNARYARLLEDAQAAVTRGAPISTAFADPFLITPTVYETIRSGEDSGQIGPLLLNIADFLDDENDVVLRSLTSILEPMILIGLGVVVAFVAVSLFMPLFDLTAMAGAK